MNPAQMTLAWQLFLRVDDVDGGVTGTLCSSLLSSAPSLCLAILTLLYAANANANVMPTVVSA